VGVEEALSRFELLMVGLLLWRLRETNVSSVKFSKLYHTSGPLSR
jgi:hypothetical protein